MITAPQDFMDYLYEIQNNNAPTKAILLPKDETIYEIDLDTRTIYAPEFLSVEKDHYAETIFFKVDRYFDNMDLTNTVCVIQYINENAKDSEGLPEKGRLYAVPFYDTTYFTKFDEEDKILFPWCIGGPATAAAGNVKFSIRFYKLNADGSKFVYNLNTKPANSKVLHGMNVIVPDNENFIFMPSQVEEIFNDLAKTRKESKLYWIDVY